MSAMVADERWTRLYRAAYPRVYRAVAATLLDAEAAKDAMQEAFLEGLRHPPGDERNLAGWLYRVALRKGHRARFRRPAPVPLIDDRAAPDVLGATLDRIEVGRLLGLLTERQRAVVVAHYYLGFTHTEVASVLGVSRGTIGATISQSMTRMRKGGTHVW
jgi:RNA polymerase sigma-70 factor (ECF subfamily)